MSEEEYDDLKKERRYRQRPDGRSMEGKWFSDTLEGAICEGKQLHPEQKFRVAGGDVPDEIADKAHRTRDIDHSGPGRFIDPVNLEKIVPFWGVD